MQCLHPEQVVEFFRTDSRRKLLIAKKQRSDLTSDRLLIHTITQPLAGRSQQLQTPLSQGPCSTLHSQISITRRPCCKQPWPAHRPGRHKRHLAQTSSDRRGRGSNGPTLLTRPDTQLRRTAAGADGEAAAPQGSLAGGGPWWSSSV